MFGFMTFIFIVIAVAMVLIILVQRPQGGGLAGAFGGAGAGGADTVFGGRVGDALTWATSIIFVLFILIAIGLNWLDNVDPTSGPADEAVTSTEDEGTANDTPLDLLGDTPENTGDNAEDETTEDTGDSTSDDTTTDDTTTGDTTTDDSSSDESDGAGETGEDSEGAGGGDE